jgi:hypothetical protein
MNTLPRPAPARRQAFQIIPKDGDDQRGKKRKNIPITTAPVYLFYSLFSLRVTIALIMQTHATNNKHKINKTHRTQTHKTHT